MERDLNIEVPGKFMNSFVKSLNRGNIPISIYVEDPPKELYYIKLVFDENYEYIGIKYDIDKPKPGELFKTYLTMPYFHLPPEIQSDIVSRTKQKNCIGFLISISSGDYCGGFTWQNSPEGYGFWEKVLNDKKYHIYFEKFSKAQSIYDESVTSVYSGSDLRIIDWDKFKTISPGKGEYKPVTKEEMDALFDKMYNESSHKYGFKPEDIEKSYSNIINKFKYESRLQEQKVDLSRRDGAKPVRVCNRRNKVRIAVKHLSHKKVLGRG